MMRAKGLIIHDQGDLAVFYITVYPIPFLSSSTSKSNAWDKVGETQSICWLLQKVIHFVM